MRALFKLLVCSLVIYLASAATQQHPKLFRPPSALAQHGVSEIPHRWLLQLRGEPCLSGRSKQQVYDEQDSLLQELRSRNISFTLHSRTTMLMNIVDLEVHQIHLERVLNLDHIIHANPVVISPNQHVKDRDHKLASLRKRFLSEPTIKYQGNSAVHFMKNVVVAHQQGLYGEGIKIGIIDSGVNLMSPALGGGCWGKPNCPHKYGHSFVDEDAETAWQVDCVGHGTGITTIIGGRTNDYIGVAPNATFGYYKVASCHDPIKDIDIIQALELAWKDGMHIINLSMGDPIPWKGNLLAMNVSKIVKEHNVYVITSAGNDQNVWSVYTPSTSPGALSVTAIYVSHKIIRQLAIGAYRASFLFDELLPPPTAQRFPMVTIQLSDLLQTYSSSFVSLDRALASQKSVVIIDQQAMTNRQILQGINVLPQSSRVRTVLIVSDSFTVAHYGSSSLRDKVPVVIVSTKYRQNILSRYASEKIIFGAIDRIGSPTDLNTFKQSSSFGPTGNFNIKPDISAPGISIKFPGSKGELIERSGTSASAAFVSGCVALLLEYRRRHNLPESPRIIQSLLQNNALPETASVGRIRQMFTVVGQGAGVIRIDKSISSMVRIEPNVLSLSATDNTLVTIQDGIFSITVTLYNDGAVPVKYRVSNRPAFSVQLNSTRCGSSKQSIGKSTMSMDSPDVITVPGGSSLDVRLHFEPPKERRNSGFAFSGYVRFTPIVTPTDSIDDDSYSKVTGANELHVPYLGYNGDISLWNLLDTSPRVLISRSRNLPRKWIAYGNVNRESISRQSEYLELEIKTIRPTLVLYLVVFDTNDNVLGYIAKKSYLPAFASNKPKFPENDICEERTTLSYTWRRWQIKQFTEENVSNEKDENDSVGRIPLEVVSQWMNAPGQARYPDVIFTD